MKAAEEVCRRVEYLLAVNGSGTAPDGGTTKWLASIGDKLHARLAAVGLVSQRAAARLGDFLDAYIAGRTDAKRWTRLNLQAAADWLTDFFGRDRGLRDFTPADADAWCIWLKGRYAPATAGRTIKRAKQFFRAALRGRLISESPFADAKAPPKVNDARQHFVSRKTPCACWTPARTRNGVCW
jgi:hypothetical protein